MERDASVIVLVRVWDRFLGQESLLLESSCYTTLLS